MYQKILVRAPNWIGDAVMAIPTLSALRARFKEAEITLLAKPSVASLFEHHPDVDRILVYEDPGRHAGLVGLLKLIRSLRKEAFDLAFLLQNAFEAAFIATAAGIPKRIGYAGDGRGLLLTRSLSRKRGGRHQLDAYLHLMNLVGFKRGRDLLDPSGNVPQSLPPWGDKIPPYLVITAGEREAALTLLEGEGVSRLDCLVGINPGAAYGPSKRWNPLSFAQVADLLIDRLHAKVIIFGSTAEAQIARRAQNEMKRPAVMLAGKTTVRQMMALVGQCRLFITNDSGPMHIASALGTPVVAVFGPTNPEATSPAGESGLMVQNKVACAPCTHRACPIDHRCMIGVTPDQVYGAAVRLLTSPVDRGAPVVFLDRDGTINRHVGYLDRPEKLELLPGAAQGIRRLNLAGIKVVVLTNQSGVARGYFSEEILRETHRRLEMLLKKEEAWVDAIYACPHAPDDSCGCRKPAPDMLRQAMRALSSHSRINRSRLYIVGDKDSDLLLGERVEGRPILVRTGYGAETEKTLSQLGLTDIPVVDDLSAAADWVLNDLTGR